MSTMEVSVIGADDLTSITDQKPKYTLGTIYRDAANGKVYQYVVFDAGAAGTAAAGQPVGWLQSTTTDYTVTTDQSVSASGLGFCGVLLAVVPDGYYCWIQIGGNPEIYVADGGSTGRPRRMP